MATYSEAVSVVHDFAVDILTGNPDIHVIGVGAKSGAPIACASGDDFCVTAVVTAKRTERELRHENIRPFDLLLRETVREGLARSIETNVIESGGPFRPLISPRSRALRGKSGGGEARLDTRCHFNTLRCGISIANPGSHYPQELSVGTLGAFVRDADGAIYLLSNNHILVINQDDYPGNAVIQPGTLDLTELELKLMPTISELTRVIEVASVSCWVPFQFHTPPGLPPTNYVDAAIAELNDKRDHADIYRLCYGGGITGVAPSNGVDYEGKPITSARVYKVGRTTGYTEGDIIMTTAAELISYPAGDVYFIDQLVVWPTPDNGDAFADNGDSGSLLLDDHHRAVGLIFAGAPKGTLVNPMEMVLWEIRNALGKQVELVTL